MKFNHILKIVLIVFLILNYTGCTLLISSYKKIHFTPGNIDLKYENVVFKNKKNTDLKGWFIKAGDGAPCVIFCEGNSQNKSYYLRFSRFLYEAGYSIFLFDYAGFGDSGGTLSEIGFQNFTMDVESAIDYIKKRPDVNDKQVSLFGWSMGGGLALYTAAKRDDIKAVIIDSGIYSFVDRFTYAVKEKIGTILGLPIMAIAKMFYSKYDPIESIKKIKNTPVLFLHGSDDIISYKEIISLYEEYKGTKRLIIFPYAGHMESYNYYKEEYIAQVLLFLNIFTKGKSFNDFVSNWDYSNANNLTVTIKNFTKDKLPMEIRINTKEEEEYVGHLLVPPGDFIFEQKIKSKPASVIVTEFYKNIKITSKGWDLYSPELSKLNIEPQYIPQNDLILPYARLAKDPEDAAEYADVILKRNHTLFHKNKRYFVSAVILANMMSPKTAAIAEKLYSLKPVEMMDNLQLFNEKMLSHPKILENLNKLPMGDPWGKKLWDDKTGKEQTVDSMVAMKKITGKITGKSASLAFFNISLLRLMGISPDNIFAVYLKGSPEHTIACFSINNNYYILNNNLLLPGEHVSWPKNEMKILGIYNDFYYLSTGLETNFKGSTIEHIKIFMENVFKNFSWSAMRSKKVENTEEAIIDLSFKFGSIPAGEISKKIQKEIFQKSVNFPESQYTYAKYAFQSLLVKKLETYAIAAKKSINTGKLVKELKTEENFIKWMSAELNKESIFEDDTRIMHPDEVITYKTGNFLDQALLLWALMDQIGTRGWVIKTDKEVYLAYYQAKNIYFIRMNGFSILKDIKNEKIIFIFNDMESFSTLSDTNTLNSEIAQIIEK